jgi:hypothetical protein
LAEKPTYLPSGVELWQPTQPTPASTGCITVSTDSSPIEKPLKATSPDEPPLRVQ